MQPSRLIAAFRITNGRRFAHQREERLVQRGRGLAPEADLDVDAVRRADTRSPGRCTRGFGSSTAATTRAMPASTIRDRARAGAAHVAARLERAVQRAAARARARPCRARAPRRAPRPRARGIPARRRRRRRDTTTAPTIGFGLVRPRPRAAMKQRARPCSRDRSADRRATTSPRTARRRTRRAENGTRSSMPSPTPT